MGTDANGHSAPAPHARTGAASGADASVAFYFDLASPECYLAAERLAQTLRGPIAWQPVLARELPGECAVDRADIEWRAREQRLQPIRWPEGFPFDSERAMVIATYAQRIGRAAAFALAAFRQAFAGGRSLEEMDNVLLAAAACEMHPRAVLRAAERPQARTELLSATRAAARAGVAGVPAVTIGRQAFIGAEAAERAAACR
jgi:2-hydroxychromene-2-carboxylate isomerase